MRTRSKRSSALLGSATAAIPAAATIAASSSRRQPSSGRTTGTAPAMSGADRRQGPTRPAPRSSRMSRVSAWSSRWWAVARQARPRGPRPSAEQRVTPFARRRLEIGRVAHARFERRVRHAEMGAERSDERRLVRGFGAQAMVDRRRLDPARIGALGEQQQGEAVGPARNGDADPRRRGPGQRFEIGAEAGGLAFHPLILAPSRRAGKPLMEKGTVTGDSHWGQSLVTVPRRDMKPQRALSRRSFLARVAGAGAAIGALASVAGRAKASRPTATAAPRGDPAGRGRGRTGESDGDPGDPAGYGRPRTGCTDSDGGANSDPAGRGRCATGESDSDSGANADAAGRGRPRTGITDSDSGAHGDSAGRGRGSGDLQRPRPRPVRRSVRARPALPAALNLKLVSCAKGSGFPRRKNLITSPLLP